MEKLKTLQTRATKMSKRWQHLTYKKLRAGAVKPEEGKALGEILRMCKCLVGVVKIKPCSSQWYPGKR